MGIIAEYQEPGLGLGIVRLQELISSIHKVKIGDTPEGTWRAYLTVRSTLYDLDPRGPEARVRALQGSAPARLKAV